VNFKRFGIWHFNGIANICPVWGGGEQMISNELGVFGAAMEVLFLCGKRRGMIFNNLDNLAS